LKRRDLLQPLDERFIAAKEHIEQILKQLPLSLDTNSILIWRRCLRVSEATQRPFSSEWWTGFPTQNKPPIPSITE
jgi:hypothetical protein